MQLSVKVIQPYTSKCMRWAGNCWEYRSRPKSRKNRRLLYKSKIFKTVYCCDHHSGL